VGELNNPEVIIGFSGATQTYAYDSAGRLISSVDTAGNIKRLAWAQDDRPTGWSVTTANGFTPTTPTTLTWDANFPRLSKIQDGSGTSTYVWQPFGQVGAGQIASIQTAAGQVLYGYDALGRISSRNIVGAAGGKAYGKNYTYDLLGRRSQEQNGLGNFAYSYLGATGQITKEMLEGQNWNTRLAYEPNAQNRALKQIRYAGKGNGKTDMDGIGCRLLPSWLGGNWGCAGGTSGGGNASLATINYQSNAIGQIIRRQQSARQTDYQYDAAGRLTAAQNSRANGDTNSNMGNIGSQDQYGYDLADNIQSIQDGSGQRAYTHDADNQINNSAWQSDAAGNVTGDGQLHYRWDAENRLAGIDYASSGTTSNPTLNKTDFTRDAWGRMVAATETTSGSAKTEQYIWCEEATPCARVDAAGKIQSLYFGQGELRLDAPATTAASASASGYGYAYRGDHDDHAQQYRPDREGAKDRDDGRDDDKDSDNDNDKNDDCYWIWSWWNGGCSHPKQPTPTPDSQGQKLYYAKDQLGSVIALVDETGKVQGEQSYSNYGAVIQQSGITAQIGYAGMWQHSRSTLNLTWYRAPIAPPMLGG